MKFQNRVLLSCVVASIVSSGVFAGALDDIVINDANTTGVTLMRTQSLNITQSGSIKVFSDTNATAAVNSDSNGSIVNSGLITTNSSGHGGYAGGIMQHTNANNITNNGTIETNSTAGSWSVGIGQMFSITFNNAGNGRLQIPSNVNYTDEGNIANNGTINVDSNTNLAAGIIEFYGDVENSGVIEANSSDAAVGVLNLHGNIENSGTINVDSSGYVSAGIAGWDGNITNSGTIVTKAENGYGVGIFSSAYDDKNISITNSGTITVDGTSGDNMGIWANSYGNTTITNTATGTITAATAIKVSSDGASSLIQNQGTINTSAIYAPTSVLINQGTINLHNSDMFDGASTIRVGTFTQTATGILSIDANLTDTNGTISVTNPTVKAVRATMANGSTINVNVISDSSATIQAFLDENGTVDNVIVTRDGVDANTTKLNITDNSPVLDFEAFMNDTNTTLSLKAVEAKIIAPKDRPMTAVSTPAIGIETLNILDTVVQNRQSSMRGLGSGDIAFKDRHMWFKPFGMYTKQDNKDGINGFDAHTYGFGMGIDGEYKEGRRAGLAFFYSNTNLDINNITQSNSLNAFNLIAYGSNPIADDKTMLFYQVGAGAQKNNAKRYVSQNGQTAKADYISQSYYAQVKVTRDYDINDKLTLVPAIKGALRYFKSPSYTESGAGAYNLSVDSVSTTQVLLGLAGNMKYKINDRTKFISNVALDYDFNNDAQSVNAYYQGTPGVVFNTSGIKNNALSYGLGLGISRELKKNLVLNIKYNLNGRGSDFINHSIQAKFRWRF